MKRKRKIIISVLATFAVFLLVTNYFFVSTLNETGHKQTIKKQTVKKQSVKKPTVQVTIEDEILNVLKQLPESYKERQPDIDNVADIFLRNIQSRSVNKLNNFTDLWHLANSWVSKTRLVDHTHSELGNVLQAMKNARIVQADLDSRGSQLKLLLTMQGNQKVIFKPKWYEKDKIIGEPVYAGKDRFGSEILAFYLSALLNLHSTPISVERRISLKKEIFPVATKKLLSASYQVNDTSCIYGTCEFCFKGDPLCSSDDSLLEGAAIFNVIAPMKITKSPWQRTYKLDKKAAWEENNEYCRTVKMPKIKLLEIVDTAIFDFLIQNGDRHHHETLGEMVILLDNGKGLGNPFKHYLDILAPLYQCCIIKSGTFRRLRSLSGGKLKELLQQMPDVDNFVTEDHLDAIERRVLIVFATVEYCRHRNKSKNEPNRTHIF